MLEFLGRRDGQIETERKAGRKRRKEKFMAWSEKDKNTFVNNVYKNPNRSAGF